MAKQEKGTDNKEIEVVGKMRSGVQLTKREMGEVLQHLEIDEENEITTDYLKIEVGEEVRCWFSEMCEIKKIKKNPTDQDEMTAAVTLTLDDGTQVINADVVIVSTCRKLKQATPISIQCIGKKGPTGGQYKVFRVFALKATK